MKYLKRFSRFLVLLLIPVLFINIFVPQAEAAAENLWGTTVPAGSKADNTRYELGTVFSPKVNGTITGVRVYAVTSESGTHTVRIWNNSTGTVVKGPNSFSAAGTGWRTYNFSTALNVTAGTSYTVSITTGGDSKRRYAYTEYALTQAGGNGQNLTYPVNAGVFTTALGTRPTQTYHSSNYFRDVVFNAAALPTPTNTPTPTFTPTPTPVACEVTTSPATHNLITGGTATISAIVSTGLGSSSIIKMRFGSYDTSIATVNPASDSASPYSTVVTALAEGVTAVWATADLSDGRICQSTGTTDTDVFVTNPTPTPTATPTPTITPTPTEAPTPTPTDMITPTPTSSVSNPENMWGTRTGATESNDPTGYELGTVFSTTVNGQITGVRVYAGTGESGDHTVRIWQNNTNTVVSGPHTFNYSGSGWREFTLPIPASIAANTQYTVSITTGTDTNKAYAYISSDLVSGGTNGNHLAYPANAGVYTTTLGTRPTQTWNSSNYLRDITFVAGNAPSPTVTPTISPTPSSTPTPDPENSPIKLGINADLGGMKAFPADDPWNQNIENFPLHPEFARIQNEMDTLAPGWQTVDIRADFGSGTYAGSPIGIPYIVAPIDQPLVPIINQAYGGDEGPYPMPPNTPIENINATDYADRHAIVVQRDTTKPNHIGHIYELFRAYPQGNYPISVTEWWASSYAKFDANANTLQSRALGQNSTDAAGLPIFPGLVRYDEVQRAIAQNGRNGDLGHAVRFTVGEFESEWSIIAPATAVAGHNTGPIPFGSRWRLRADWQVPADWPAEVAVIINTLKKYGMLQADNSAYWGITGSPDERWDNNALSLLRYIKKGDFQMVDTGSIIQRTP